MCNVHTSSIHMKEPSHTNTISYTKKDWFMFLAKIDRRSRKRAPPKLGAKQKKKKKQSHATSGKRQKARQDFERRGLSCLHESELKMKSSPSVHVTKLNKYWLIYWPSSRSNIWQRSIQANPLKWYKKKKKKHFGSNLVKMNTDAPVGCRCSGRLAAPVPLTVLTGTLPKVVELASHGESGRAENSQKHSSFSERV
ncbi:hypothetical protein J6590_001278 [Homalodisca vitripennis]|nr:hypothetical protein J6590_001278 [Homalodisca vitripennis]